jgi:hypothetical protein
MKARMEESVREIRHNAQFPGMVLESGNIDNWWANRNANDRALIQAKKLDSMALKHKNGIRIYVKK